MFITKNLISFFGNKNRPFDVNNFPDLDSPDDIQRFLKSLKPELKILTFDEEIRGLVEFLVDISEKYEVEKYFSEDWLQVINKNIHSPLFQALLDISLSMCDRDSHFFDVVFN
jgi:hypothetical protein